MCGICGVVALGREPELATAEAMAATLAHRGPDGSGTFVDPAGVAFGHRRLAIIDLSDAGLQPFASHDGRLQLLHNGEIYNYRELRHDLERRGHRFRSETDTEVVLASYREWGDDCVERFNGMWAIAIWDGDRRRLFCSRDRFGVKPFYYRWDGARFVFASELKAFRADPRTSLAPNLRAVRDYLEQGYVDHTDESFFAGIDQLPPAHSLVVDEDGLHLRRHWSLEPKDPPAQPEQALRELFLDSVALRLRSDVPVGTALSGGLDSSAVASAIGFLLRERAELATSVGPRQRTFTAFFDEPGYDERPYARDVVHAVDAAPEWISFDAAATVDVLPAVVESQDEPFGSTSIVAQWFVMRAAARAGVRVMLDGQGADEILFGYPSTTFSYLFAELASRGEARRLLRELQAYRALQSVSAVQAAVGLATPFLPANARWRLRARRDGGPSLMHPSLRGRRPTRESLRSPFPDRLRRQYHLILAERGLPELLRYEDRNSMAHSVEARVPFLDYRLVELVYSLPAAALVQLGVTKLALRRSLADLLPSTVRDRVDKLGFVTPGGTFFAGALGNRAREVLRDERTARRGFVDSGAARERLERAIRTRRDDRPLWRVLNLELWARTFLD